jgi:hypothetical protein
MQRRDVVHWYKVCYRKAFFVVVSPLAQWVCCSAGLQYSCGMVYAVSGMAAHFWHDVVLSVVAVAEVQ